MFLLYIIEGESEANFASLKVDESTTRDLKFMETVKDFYQQFVQKKAILRPLESIGSNTTTIWNEISQTLQRNNSNMFDKRFTAENCRQLFNDLIKRFKLLMIDFVTEEALKSQRFDKTLFDQIDCMDLNPFLYDHDIKRIFILKTNYSNHLKRLSAEQSKRSVDLRTKVIQSLTGNDFTLKYYICLFAILF